MSILVPETHRQRVRSDKDESVPWPGLGREGYDGHLTVVCLYIGSSRFLAAFGEKYSAPGQPIIGTAVAYTADGVRNHLPADLMADLVQEPWRWVWSVRAGGTRMTRWGRTGRDPSKLRRVRGTAAMELPQL